ncbi:MAG: sirohydrochlorin chelatase [Dehalococcoidia bacterium]|nr:sirohydrochlorin chelatase [Dehalococcoidia bacterium]MSQ16072.1 sirohydrochlorin chelatase [Dehalococcoidia bacterium]
MPRAAARPQDAGQRVQAQQADWGVIMLCHGSQRGGSRAECSCVWRLNGSELPGWCLQCPSTPVGLRETASRLQEQLTPERAQVVLSCLEFIQPHPPQAVRALALQGLRRIVIAPFLLGHGKHATLELQEVLEDLRRENPQAQIHLAGGLGADPRIAEVVVERVRALGGPPARPTQGRPAGVLVVKAGTKTQYDDCLWLAELGSMVEKGLGLGYAVTVAQSHYGDPTMESAVARLVDQRRVSSLTCVPYLLFPGLILQRNVLGTMSLLQDRYPGLPMAVTPPLGADPRLAAVAADRIQEVWRQVDGAV